MDGVPTIRRRAHTPPQAASMRMRNNLNAKAAANPLRPGSPNYYREAQAQQLAAAQQTASYAAGASRAFKRKNMESGFWHADKALGALVRADPLRRVLHAEDIPVTPYQAPVAPAPYNPVFPTYSGAINLRPDNILAAKKAPASAPMHPPKNLSEKPVPERSTMAKVCSGLTCGLSNYIFGNTKSEGGRRRTKKNKNKNRKKRQSRKM